ncbi:DUF4174 domain-containing protein [Glacieibacterium megasporae]|uniref:DUF4174 domain-containing protein n=1 Tax=Glacieibacterium megasporae TaxID=2835787 RepID=UPI001C1DF814|nr:DUF4174 domain-containing protein [Polymorphobacter megasporae]UAJ08798.1 DUF4174 domain-containing protein [Polymorphobacter megasporae]
MKQPIAVAAPLAASLLGAALLGASMPADAASVAALRDQRRVLIVAAPADSDPQLALQRRALAGWQQGAVDRDISVVEVVGTSVTGAADTANALERRYALPSGRFAVVLIGKDGHVAMRSAKPVPAAMLEATIDAMPMRRAGQR